MSGQRAQTSTGDRGYKRSWKNLLINKRYQLRFTLFMVGLSGLLMIGLGVWVMKEANEATAVGTASVRGVSCGPTEVKPITAPVAAAEDDPPPTPMKLDDPAGSATDAGSAGGSAASGSAGSAAGSAAAGSAAAGSADAEPPRRRPNVQITEDQMTMVPSPGPAAPPAPTAAELAARMTAQQIEVFSNRACTYAQAAHFEHLEVGRFRIFIVLIITGLTLVVGLAVYGIKMTHKVAGPLFKVSLYLNKMREGRLDKVWNLRKGDQLVDFYEHFKHAHAGLVTMEKSDIERLRAVIASAEASGLGEHAAVAELRELLGRKEKSLE